MQKSTATTWVANTRDNFSCLIFYAIKEKWFQYQLNQWIPFPKQDLEASTL
jgi:hypothetical protein